MKRQVTVTVVFPQTFTIDVEDDKDVAYQQVIEHAFDLILTSESQPIVTNCEEFPELVD